MPEHPKPVMSHAFGALFQEERVRRADENTWGIIDAEALPPKQLEIQPTARCHRVCSFC
jgi:hypothetical protein